MKKSKILLFGLIFALTACGGGGGGSGGSGGGSDEGIPFDGNKVTKEEFISLAETTTVSNPYNYATLEYELDGSYKTEGTAHYYYEDGSWKHEDEPSTSIFDFLLTNTSLQTIVDSAKSGSYFADFYVEPFGVHHVIYLGGSGTSTTEYIFEEHGLIKEYCSYTYTNGQGRTYYESAVITYSFVA